MPHQLIPSNFKEKIALLKTIKEKVDADQATGPLVAMLEEKGINLVLDTAKGAAAIVFDDNFRRLSKLSQNQKQKQNAVMKIIIDDITGSYQNLKTLYEPNFKAVGDWGAVITDGGKFTNPTNFAGWMDWFTLLKAKHDSYVLPAVSPLLTYLTITNISLTDDATNGAAALLNQAVQAANKKASEKARQNRDIKFNPVVTNIHSIVNYLFTLYPNNEKALGDYGIKVVLTPKIQHTRNKVIKSSTSLLNMRVGIGSTIVNRGSIALPIYKGATISGTPVLLAVGGTYTIAPGFGRVSVHNPTTDVVGLASFVPKKLSV